MAVRPHDAGAVLHVVNSGPPIPGDALARLPEPFQRLDRCSDGHGSGLGLSIVRSVAEAHGGALELRSREGGGLDVTVTLPAVSAARAEPGARPAPRPAPVESGR
jgi:signal transduction histidine kinase